jgi:hypothetical protein
MQFHLQFESDTVEEEGHFSQYKIMIHPGEKLSETIQTVTLSSFTLDEERESLLLKYLDKFSSTLTPFRRAVNDSSFTQNLAALHLQLNIILKIEVHVPKKYLGKPLINQIDANYSSEFTVDKIVLLKRNTHKVFEVCKEFYFF